MKGKTQPHDEIRTEYDLDYSQAVRGKYYRRLMKEGSNIVVLDPDVAQRFRSSAAVNEALRELLRVSQTTRRLTARSGEQGRSKGFNDGDALRPHRAPPC